MSESTYDIIRARSRLRAAITAHAQCYTASERAAWLEERQMLVEIERRLTQRLNERNARWRESLRSEP